MATPQLTAYSQGQTSVTADRLNTFCQTCTSVAQLRGIIGVSGMEILLRGLSTDNDGGAGAFYWDSSATGPDNGTNVIVPTGAASGAWVRLQNYSSASAIQFPTTAALLGAFANTIVLANGTVAVTTGRTAVNDGGAAAFFYNSADTTTADNGGTIRVDGAGRRWYAVTNGVINICLFGASTSSTDNQAAINSAITGVGSNGGIFIPAGSFLTAGNHPPLSGQEFTGVGTLKLTASNSNPIFRTAEANVVIDGLKFDLSNESSGGPAYAVIVDGNSSNVVVRNCYSLNGQIITANTNSGTTPTGIKFLNNTLDTPYVGSTSSGALGTNDSTNDFVISGNLITGSTGAGIALQSSSNKGIVSGNVVTGSFGNGIFVNAYITDFVILGNEFLSNSQSGIGLNATTSHPSQIVISGNLIAYNTFDGMDINEPGSSDPLTNLMILSITGNVIHDNGYGGGSAIGTGMYLSNLSHVSITGNQVYNNNLQGILLSGCANINVTGNNAFGNGTYSAGHTAGITVAGSTYCIVNSNISTNNGEGTATQTYGIQETGASDYNVYVGNMTQNNVTGGLSQAGVNNVAASNL